MRVSIILSAILLGLAHPAPSAPVSAENDWYVVLADPARNGAYAVGTGALHPVTVQEGQRSNVLRGGGPSFSGGSFNTVRSYGSGTDYRLGHRQFVLVDDPDFDCVIANDAAVPVVTPIVEGAREVGLLFSWDIDQDGDRLLVEQRLVARGETLTEAAAEVTLSITNLGPAEALVGIRYVWAWAVGNTGGVSAPTIGPKPPESPMEPFTAVEQVFPSPGFRSIVASLDDTPSEPAPIGDNPYLVEATVGGIPLDPPPTPPDRFLHTRWGEQLMPPREEHHGPLNTCFAYDISDPPRSAYLGPANAGVYFWGDTPETARVIPPGESFSVTQYVFAYLTFPVTCDAGPPQVVECAGGVTDVVLDGTGSANLGGEAVEHLWTSEDPDVVLEDETLPRPLAHVSSLGLHEVDLLAHRGPHASGCMAELQVVDTTAPELTVPDPIVLFASDFGPESCALPALLVATARDLCAADIEVTHVTDPFLGAGGAEAEYDFPPGTTRVNFTAADPSGNTATGETSVTVIDDVPPHFVALEVEPQELWPPNHQMVEVQVRVIAADNCEPAPVVTLLEVLSSEPDDDRGDGHTWGDVQGAELGTADFSFSLRAERDGRGTGRSYLIRYQVEDAHGNTALGEAEVRVVHDRGRRR